MKIALQIAVAFFVADSIANAEQPDAKIAFITGANRGIGFEVARELGAKGFRVFIGARNADAGRAAAQSIVKAGGNAQFVEIDVTKIDSVNAAAREIGKSADHLDVLVNNAGVMVKGDGAILNISDDALRESIETNSLGALRVTQRLLPLLQKSKSPRVINVSSRVAQLSSGSKSWTAAYAVSKTALNAITAQLAAALPQMAVNSASPGWVRTRMGGPFAERSVEEGADTIIWLATDAPQSLTGKFVHDRKEIPW